VQLSLGLLCSVQDCLAAMILYSLAQANTATSDTYPMETGSTPPPTPIQSMNNAVAPPVPGMAPSISR